MPLLAHAFVGLGAFLSISGGLRDFAFLLPWILLLAYFPDIASQLLLAGGFREGRLLGHSIWLALGAAAIASLLLRRTGLHTRVALVVAGAGPISHVLLDALQSTDRLPWWPLSRAPLLAGAPLLPGGSLGEVVVLAGCSLAAVAVALSRARSGQAILRPVARQSLHRLSWSVSLAIVLAAAGVSVLRDSREKQFWDARLLILDGKLDQGLNLLESSDRWPFASPPGRADYLRGWAFLSQGKRELAELHFLRSYRADPSYLWVVVDTALFYAQGPYSTDARRTLAAPFLCDLASRFPGNEDAQRAEKKVRTLLGDSSSKEQK